MRGSGGGVQGKRQGENYSEMHAGLAADKLGALPPTLANL